MCEVLLEKTDSNVVKQVPSLAIFVRPATGDHAYFENIDPQNASLQVSQNAGGLSLAPRIKYLMQDGEWVAVDLCKGQLHLF